jgi:hypothetical protein
MKLLHIFLSIYILALSSLACTDADVSHVSSVSEISAAQSSDSHEDETCSPFCICACCGSVAVHFSEKAPVKHQEFIFNRYFLSQESDVIDISFSVWQPPKIA